MQISDMLGKYNQNTASVTAKEQTAKAGTQELTGTLAGLKEGNIFEGTVKSARNGQVVLVLANGESITARIEGKIDLQLNQSMFFEVKSNTQTQIAIKPYLNGNGGNPTLFRALTEAGLAATEENLKMVKTMMEEQMPIDRQSLGNMAKQIASFPGTDVSALVQMNRLGIPVTEGNIQQFLNYREDAASIMGELEGIIEELPQSFKAENLTAEQMRNQNGELLKIFLPEQQTAETVPQIKEINTTGVQSGERPWIPQNIEEVEVPPEKLLMEEQTGAERGVAQLLTEEENVNLRQQLEQLGMGENKVLFDETGQLRGTPEEFLQKLQTQLEQMKNLPKQELEQLFSGKEYQKLLKEAIGKQWFIQPEQVGKENTVKKLYEKLQDQMGRLEEFAKQNHLEHTGFKQAVSTVRNNIEFMNQINHIYNFVQIPLKMQMQNVNSQLYVYSNKKNLRDPEGELSAFLHLDMDHLGSTDVSVKMKGTQVNTQFYMEDDESYDLILSHAEELAKKLEQKGYQCEIQVQNDKKKVDFVEDFLKQDLPSTGRLRRYSFDMRA
ncbi:MAG: flagellar hook-length control protein FliK [Lachnospiraceae bacterium]|nr:flagellar hook-length control protein FliK [Lachnospiraceae bacterium]MDD7379482.1 flagellar hook-length control protein FliK [Lachnospiraceae bacterium]MDY4617293.1 flagellar hook-length control protein FliK [Lachnospiraceae bacterium]